MVGNEMLFGPELRAGGRSSTPINRWLVTEQSKSHSRDSQDPMMECNGQVSDSNSMHGIKDVNNGNYTPGSHGEGVNEPLKGDNIGVEEEGVVFVDPKRRRVVGQDDANNGLGPDGSSPSMMDVQHVSTSYGAGSAMQARQAL